MILLPPPVERSVHIQPPPYALLHGAALSMLGICDDERAEMKTFKVSVIKGSTFTCLSSPSDGSWTLDFGHKATQFLG